MEVLTQLYIVFILSVVIQSSLKHICDKETSQEIGTVRFKCFAAMKYQTFFDQGVSLSKGLT